MSDDADQPPEQFPELRYTILVVYQDGTSDLHCITAQNSVDAITLGLRNAEDVRLVHCRRMFA